MWNIKKVMRYSVQPWDRIFVKGYAFLPFAKSILVEILVKMLVKT